MSTTVRRPLVAFMALAAALALMVPLLAGRAGAADSSVYVVHGIPGVTVDVYVGTGNRDRPSRTSPSGNVGRPADASPPATTWPRSSVPSRRRRLRPDRPGRPAVIIRDPRPCPVGAERLRHRRPVDRRHRQLTPVRERPQRRRPRAPPGSPSATRPTPRPVERAGQRHRRHRRTSPPAPRPRPCSRPAPTTSRSS